MLPFISLLRSWLNYGQRLVLDKFLDDEKSGRIPTDITKINSLLEQTGSVLVNPGNDVTKSVNYNDAIQRCIANISGLYQELDQIDLAQLSVHTLLQQQLSQIENGVSELSGIVNQAYSRNLEDFQATDTFHETFDSDNSDNDPRWFSPKPLDSRINGPTSFLYAKIDPSTNTLQVKNNGDFIRTRNARGEPTANIEIDQFLGINASPDSPVKNCIDGKTNSYWRCLSVSDVPITSSSNINYWLPSSYTEGAAIRLHIKFPFSVPVSELYLRQAAAYPLRVLQVVWDNKNYPEDNIITNSNFTSGSPYWTSSSGVTFEVSGGFNNSPSAKFVLADTQEFVQTTDKFVLPRSSFAYYYHVLLRRTTDVEFEGAAIWYGSGGVILRNDRFPLKVNHDRWEEAGILLNAPDNSLSGQVLLLANGNGNGSASKITFSPTTGLRVTDETIDKETGILRVPTEGAYCTDLWVVVNQRHYDLVTESFDTVLLNRHKLSQSFNLDKLAGDIGDIENTDFTQSLLGSSDIGYSNLDRSLVDTSSWLYRQISSLRGLLSSSNQAVTRSLFTYDLSILDLQARHREYAGQGLWLSKPYPVRGDVREIRLVSDPDLTQLVESRDKPVNFFLTLRDEDGPDKSVSVSGRVTITAEGESYVPNSTSNVVLPVVSLSQQFNGTDENGKLQLPYNPYINMERIHSLQYNLTSGDTEWPSYYNPNKSKYYVYRTGTPADREKRRLEGRTVTLEQIEGYRPISVTIRFKNGLVATPDIFGPSRAGDIGYASGELLNTIELSDELISSASSRGAAFSEIARTLLANLRNRGIDQLTVSDPIVNRTRRTTIVALTTKNKPVISSLNGTSLTLYWHKSSDVSRSGPTSGMPITTGDVLISPTEYQVDAYNGIITVNAQPTNANSQYDSFIAYYYYRRSETRGRESFDTRDVIPTSGIDISGNQNQNYPVTRNVTDYIDQSAATLIPPVLDDLSAEYYPVFEYYIDDRSNIHFSVPLHPYGDTPATIIVDYASLKISPRLAIEFPALGTSTFSHSTRLVKSVTLFMGSRV